MIRFRPLFISAASFFVLISSFPFSISAKDPENNSLCKETLARLFREYSHLESEPLTSQKSYIVLTRDEKGSQLFRGKFTHVKADHIYFKDLEPITIYGKDSDHYGQFKVEKDRQIEGDISLSKVVHISPAEVTWDRSMFGNRLLKNRFILLTIGFPFLCFLHLLDMYKLLLDPFIPIQELGSTKGGVRLTAGFPYRKQSLQNRSAQLIKEIEKFEEFSHDAGFNSNSGVLLTIRRFAFPCSESGVGRYIRAANLASVKAKIDLNFNKHYDSKYDFPSTSLALHEIVHTITLRQLNFGKDGETFHKKILNEALSDFIPALFLNDPKIVTTKTVLRDIEDPFNKNAVDRLILSLSDPLIATSDDEHLLSLPISNLFWSLRTFLDPRVHPGVLQKYSKAIMLSITEKDFDSRPQFYKTILNETIKFFSMNSSRDEIYKIVDANAKKMALVLSRDTH
ncbi:MAG: hypothetical protein JWQ35_306 [Bacteriovoracaceae bacterium]|nr:hypothetical protein [Bacteriovoracaceae bacterium]